MSGVLFLHAGKQNGHFDAIVLGSVRLTERVTEFCAANHSLR